MVVFESTSPHEATYPPVELDSSSSPSLLKKLYASEGSEELRERRIDDHRFWTGQFLKMNRYGNLGPSEPVTDLNELEFAFYEYVTKFQMGLEEGSQGNYEEAQSHLYSSLLARAKLRGRDHWTVAEVHIFLRDIASKRGDKQSVKSHEREILRISKNTNDRIRFRTPPFDTAHYFSERKKPSVTPQKQGPLTSPSDSKPPPTEPSEEQIDEDKDQDRKPSYEAAAAPGATFVPFDPIKKIDAPGEEPRVYEAPVESDEFTKFRTELENISNDDRNTQTKLILDYMINNPKDVNIQACGMSHIWEKHGISEHLYRSSPSAHSKIEIFRVIVNGMKENMKTSADVQYYGCGALWSLAANMADISHIVEAGGCECAVHALKEHPSEEEHVARTALGLIKSLSADVLGHSHLQSAEATKAVAATMRKHWSSVELQKTGCAILANLAMDFSVTTPLATTNTANFREEIFAIVNAMKLLKIKQNQHPANHKMIHQYGLLALSNCAKLDPASRSIITSPNVLEVIVQCMKQFEENELIQDRACEVLWFSIHDDMSRLNIAFADAPERVVKALQLFTRKRRLNVVQAALGLIQTLSIEEDCKTQLKRLGVKDAILEVMNIYNKDPQVQESGCHILANLVFSRDGNEKQKVHPIGLDEIDRVASAIDLHPNNKKILISACAALKNFAFLDSNVELMRHSSYDVLGLLKRATERYPEDCEPKTRRVIGRLVERYR